MNDAYWRALKDILRVVKNLAMATGGLWGAFSKNLLPVFPGGYPGPGLEGTSEIGR